MIAVINTVIENSRFSFPSFCGVPAFTFLIYYFAASIFVKARPTDPLQKDPTHNLPSWLFLHILHLYVVLNWCNFEVFVSYRPPTRIQKYLVIHSMAVYRIIMLAP